MTTVETGSRLHFGLFNLHRFGGAGMMVDEPAVVANAELFPEWTITGHLPGRTRAVVDRLRQYVPDLPPMNVGIARTPPEHVGLGSGTQVSLAVAMAILHQAGRHVSVSQVAGWLGRGKRSAIGIHGFEHGGFLVDAGKQLEDGISPLAARVELPAHWRILLATPRTSSPWSGELEQRAFEKLTTAAAGTPIDPDLSQLAVTELAPAAAAGDLTRFGASLTEYNRRAGTLFAAVQGGAYASDQIQRLICRLQDVQLTGVGQSSWGPTVFAFSDNERELHAIANELAKSDCSTVVARPRPCGAIVT